MAVAVMTALVFVLVVLLVAWLVARGPTPRRGCCSGGPWPPDDLGRTERPAPHAD